MIDGKPPVNPFPLPRRIFVVLGTGAMAGAIAILLVIGGLDFLVDWVVNLALQSHISNGALRLAGISAPLSEEPARLLGILASIRIVMWLVRRNGLGFESLRIGGELPWGWIFGMTAGLVFAVIETFINGDAAIAILPRSMAHGTYAALVTTALLWGRQVESTWPVFLAVGISIVLHGTNNSLRALGLGQIATYVLLGAFVATLIITLWAARHNPQGLGCWRFE